MKKLKKTMAVVLAVMVALTMGIATTSMAFAAPSDASNSYKVAKVEVSGIKAGNTLKLYKIVQFNLDATTNAFDYTLATGLPAAYDTIDELAALTPDGYTLADAGATIRTAADVLANGIAAGTITPIGTAVTATAANNKATIENLPAGWYVAVVSGTEDDSIIYQNMIIDAMPQVDSANNTYKKADDVSFEVKHTNVTIEKTVNGGETTDDYSVGDTVPYTITTNLPNYPNPSKEASFVIKDTPTALTDDVSSVKVTVTGDDATGTAAGSVSGKFTVAASGDGFTVTFAKDYLLAHPGAAVTVTYNATINTDAVIAADGKTAENTGSVIFNPNPNETGTVEPDDTTTVYTYGVNVYKYDESTGSAKTKLTGASFILYKADGTTVAGEETAVDENGYVSWNGLAAGSYKLVETVAPSGYKLDSTPIDITISDSTATTDDRATANATETNFLQKDVPNEKGTTLPSTGGIGTTIFYILGALLVVGCGVILIARRRMHAGN